MSYVDNTEFKGILIALTGYVLLSSALNYFVGTFSLKFPWLFLPLAASLFIASKYFSDRVPFLHGDGYIGQVFQIILVITSYALFMKSLSFYMDPYVKDYTFWMFIFGVSLIIYASKHKLAPKVGGG